MSWEGAGDPPVALSSLVGRQAELDSLASTLPGSRLLTIVGAGGCGKTRLALALAERCREDFPDGVRWVGLGPLLEPDLLAPAVADALGVPESPGEDAAAAVCRELGGRRVLLVLDNCEHVVRECAEFAEHLLARAPSLTILATSRELIGVAGERVFRLAGLEMPGAGASGGGGALELFAERAEAIAPGFRLGEADLAMAVRLCRLVDGLPLALELAAARVSALGLAEIVSRLEEGQRVFRHPRRTAPARHQTLEATLEWSDRLLTAAERALFRRLSIFQGSFSLLAAESVAAGGDAQRQHVVDLLAALVDKSLVQAADHGVEHRYRLLHIVQQYARSQLESSGELPAVQAAHGEFYLGLAEQAHAGLQGAEQARWLQRLDLEHDNLNAALKRRLPDDPETGGRLAALLWPYWYRRGRYQEARAWLEQAAAASDSMSPPVRAEVLTGVGVLAFLQCEYERASERLRVAQSLFEQEGHLVGSATALQRLGSIAREQAQYPRARQLHEASMAIWSRLGDEAGVAASHDYLGFVAWLEGNPAEAQTRCAQALAYFEACGRRQETASALINLGAAIHYAGDDASAAAVLRRALAGSRDIGYLEGVAWASHELGLAVAPAAEAAGLLAESLAIHMQLGDRWRTASVVEAIAARCAESAPADSARMLAAAARVRETLGAPVPPAERPAIDATLASIRAALGQGAFQHAWDEGLALTLPDAAELARRSARGLLDARDAGGAGAQHGLTEREVAVLRLIAAGLTNREIGQRLFISTGTAAVHVSNILRKLGVSSRVQAAAIARELESGG